MAQRSHLQWFLSQSLGPGGTAPPELSPQGFVGGTLLGGVWSPSPWWGASIAVRAQALIHASHAAAG